MSNMDLRFGKLGAFNTKILKSRTALKWIFLVSVLFVLSILVAGVILISIKPEINAINLSQTVTKTTGFYKTEIFNLQTHQIGTTNPLTYLSYEVHNWLSVGGIVYVSLASFGILFNIFAFLMVRFYKPHNTVNYHIITITFTLFLIIFYIIVTAVGLTNKVNSQDVINYETTNYYQFNFTYSLLVTKVSNSEFIMNYSWTMGSLAFVGTMLGSIGLCAILFIWFGTGMLLRQPHFRYDIYYTIYDSEKQKRGIKV